MSKLLIITGILSLIHCGYSAAQYRSYLRLIEKDFESLPLDLIAQALLSLFVTLCGIIQTSSDFKEIRALNELRARSIETIENRPSFYLFDHRGRLLNQH